MTVEKHPILPHLVRQVPDQFSWIDHRLVRDNYIDCLSHPASALYLFLITVADNRGLSYYSDTTLGKRLAMAQPVLSEARNVLIRHHLIAYRKPLYQVLALDRRRDPVQTEADVVSLGQILQQMAGGSR